MPPQQNKQPDFIPAPQQDFIPAETAPTATQEPEGNVVQRAFDKLTTVTPEQEQGHSAPVNAAQKFGAGAMRLATPLVHPLNAIEHAGDVLHPQNTMSNLIEGVKEDPWGTAGTLTAGGALGGVAGEVAPRVMAKIPTRAKAGAVFNDIGQKMANTPIDLTQSTPQLEQLEKIGAAGPGVPSTVGKLLDRTRMIEPINYPEARLFQENLSGPSTTEKMGMGGSMKGGVKQLNKAFYGDIKGALDPHGLGEDYAGAMRDYARAAQMNKMARKVGKAAGYGAAGALGVGAGARLIKDLAQ